MSARVSVGKSYTDPAFLVGAILAPIVLALVPLVLVASGPIELAVILGVVAAGLTVLAVVRYFVVARNRRWLSATDTGFLLTDFRGEVELADEDVSDLGTWSRLVYANGKAKCQQRTGLFVLSAGESSATFPFAYKFPLGARDPLGMLFERLFNKLVMKAKASLGRGGQLTGEGWALTQDELVYAEGAEDVELPINQIAVVDIADGKLCVWAKGAAAAELRVPAGSRNALVLCQVLQEMLPPQSDEGEAGDGLGRIIFQRDKSWTVGNIVAGIVLVGLALVVGVVGCVAAVLGLVEGGGYVLGPGALGAAALGTWALVSCRVDVFRCHAFGVARTTSSSARKLRFEDCGSFTYQGTRHYVNGAYTGTQINLTFEPLEPGRGDGIVYNTTVKNADEELDNLREHISRVIAGHMLGRLKAGKRVRWTPNIRFVDEGLEVRKGGWFGSNQGETELIPYGEIGPHDLTDGVFRIALRGSKKWKLQEKVSQPNFFPGLVLLMMLLSEPPETTG